MVKTNRHQNIHDLADQRIIDSHENNTINGQTLISTELIPCECGQNFERRTYQ